MKAKFNYKHYLFLFAAVLILAFTSGSILKNHLLKRIRPAQRALTRKFVQLDQIANSILIKGETSPPITEKEE
jgi:hypothetical protein